MKRKILTILLVLGITAFTALRVYKDGFYFYKFASASPGILEVEYLGNPISGPIFNVSNMLPGDCEERDVLVKNSSSNSFEVFVKSDSEIDADNLSTQIDWEIKKGAITLLSSILKNFYDDNDGITLGNFTSGSSSTIKFKGCFKPTAGNEYQDTMTQFNLVFYTKFGSTPSELPAECSHLQGKIKKFVIGNDSNQHLFGSAHPDFIDGRGGNDHIFGISNNDCLVGGDGNDTIYGDSGHDFIIGGNGNDTLRGGSGDDSIWGNSGNDNIFGGSGPDKLYGGDGNDTIHADSGTDLLDGGANTDNLHGGTGTDTCLNGETNASCEL